MDVIGDVHGQLDKLSALLRSSGLIDCNDRWVGGHRKVWFMGDLVDRGPDGIGVIRLVMRLQAEARSEGGQVCALLGNHDVLLLAADRFGTQRAGGPGGTFIGDWRLNGGNPSDLEWLSDKERIWLSQLPAMAVAEDYLLVHADSLFYEQYGDSVFEVNTAITSLLQNGDSVLWDTLLEDFSDRLAFWDNPQRAEGFLKKFMGNRLIHGHTPVSYMNSESDGVKPIIYANGACVNVDGGLYLGGKGFIYSSKPKF